MQRRLALRPVTSMDTEDALNCIRDAYLVLHSEVVKRLFQLINQKISFNLLHPGLI